MYAVKPNRSNNNTNTKFQGNIFIFGCEMTENQVKLMTLLFETHFWHFYMLNAKDDFF